MEKRLLLAFVLSAAILLAWSVIFPPPQRPQTPAPSDVGPQATPEVMAPAAAPPGDAEAAAEEALPDTLSDQVVGATVDETVKLSNKNVAVVLTNRGAAVSSYQLLGYDSDNGEPLELIQTVPLAETSLPLQLMTANGPDDALYEVERIDGAVFFRWADGRGNAVTKRVALSDLGYGLDVEVMATGTMAGVPISIGTGMRDLGEAERNSRLALWGEGITLADGELTRFKRRKVKEPRILAPGALGFAGFEDAYFLNLFRPDGGVAEVRIEPLEFAVEEETETVLRVTVIPARGELRGQLLGAPKEYDLLQSINQGVEKTLTFGSFLTPIAVFFLKALRWIYGVVGNWGVSIILLTLGIRIVLFPLMHTSTVSMRKMQKVQPKVKEIQAKHKKKKSDPQARAKMNQEMMALYKIEGVNPMAGCLPLLVQMPLLFALYQLF
jgi:YidC/Oxa1 family membrane protein insertase